MEITKSSCIHSRKLVSLLDMSLDDKKFSNIKKHIHDCKFCRDKMSIIVQERKVLEDMIPSFSSEELQNSFNNEIRDMIKKIHKEKSMPENSFSFVYDIYSAVVSPTMIGVYLAVILIGSFLKLSL